ncbi:hypothetical protein B0T10DRAFT_473453 [Thelonectria olida]|uniref:Uncharacterized protein n=1 Tax=Thelonectria olida TaxID=1576542 RepID=A0A9P8WFY6_9HYPO|nr:hypothetical protein B0T10DRAFT_473453 [Thelonectria olida]
MTGLLFAFSSVPRWLNGGPFSSSCPGLPVREEGDASIYIFKYWCNCRYLRCNTPHSYAAEQLNTLISKSPVFLQVLIPSRNPSQRRQLRFFFPS